MLPLSIGHLSTFYHTSTLLIAKGKIQFLLGRPVQWQLFPTGPAIIEEFQKGKIDMAYIGLPPVIIGIDKGIRIKCIAGGHIEGTVLVSSKYMEGYPELDDLKEILSQFHSKKIGVPQRGSIHDVVLSELLKRFNLKDDIEIVNFRWADEILEAFVKGNVHAALGTPALAVAIKRFGDGKILCPPSMLWHYNPSYGIVVTEDIFNREKDLIKRFIELHESETNTLRKDPEKAAEIISSFVSIVDKEFVFETITISPRYCAQLNDNYINSTMDFVRAMKRLGYISREIKKEEIFDLELIRSIHGTESHY